MAEATKSHGSRIGFLGLLTLLFIALKLTGYIDWSWWWVLAPLWGPFALAAAVIGIGWLVAFGLDLNDRRRSRKWRAKVRGN